MGEGKLTEMDRLVRIVHEALGGDGWAYSNYGMAELVTHRAELEAVVTALASTQSSSQVTEWPGQNYELYEVVHNLAITAYEAATPADYRYSASALRRAVDAAITAALSPVKDS